MNNRDNDAPIAYLGQVMLQQRLGELKQFLEKMSEEKEYANAVPGLTDKQREKVILDIKETLHRTGKRGTLLSQGSIVELDKKVRAVEPLKDYQNFLKPEKGQTVKHKL